MPAAVDFAARSVTFVSAQSGWVLGTALCGSSRCTSVVRTSDADKTWVAVPAPAADLSLDQSAGVHEIRFANADNGWAFGPDLWATHDSGAPGSAVAAGIDDGTTVLLATFDAGSSWNSVYWGANGQSRNDLGFTTARQGVAVAMQPDAHTGDIRR